MEIFTNKFHHGGYKSDNSKKKKCLFLRYLTLILFFSASFTTVKASRNWDCNRDFVVTYNKEIGAYEFKMSLHDSETWAANKNFAILKNTIIQVKRGDEGWHSIIKLNGASYFNVLYTYEYMYSSLTGWNGAMWVQDQNDNYQQVPMAVSTNIQYDYKENDFIYKTIRWYPPSGLVGADLSFSLKEGMWDRNWNTDDTYFNNSCIKSNIRMEDPTSEVRIISNTIDLDGNNVISYTLPTYTSQYDYGSVIELQYSDNNGNNWSALTKHSITAASGEFKGSFMGTNKNTFINGRSFRFEKRKAPDPSKYGTAVYIKRSESSVTQKYSVLNSLTAIQNDKVINFNWATEGYQANETGNYEILVKKNNQWVLVNTELGNIPLSRTSAEYTLPEAELEFGKVPYEYMIRRNNFNIGALSQFFQKTATINVETNYRKLKSFNYETSGLNVILNWDLEQGIWSNTDIKYTIAVDGVIQDPGPAINATSYTIENLETCKKYQIVLRLITVLGNREISKITLSDVSIPDNTPGTIQNLTVSKGYYTDKVMIRWEIPAAENNFTYFEISREEISSNQDPVQLEPITYSGKNTINFEDKNIDPGVYYRYYIEGFTSCNNEVSSVAKQSSIGFSQPYGSVSGQITYEGRQGVEGVDVLVVGDAQNSTMKNRALEFSPTRSGDPFVGIPLKNKNMENFTFQTWVQVVDDESSVKKTVLDIPNYFSLVYKDKSFKVNDIVISGDSLIKSLNYYHISLCYDNTSSKVSVYLNGVLTGQAQVTPSLDKNNLAIYIGGQKTNPIVTEELFNGYIDEIRVWNRSLSESEIKSNYDRFITGKENGLVAYYRCDEINEVTGVLFDLSAISSTNFNRNDAILGNSILRVDSKDKIPSSEQLATKGTTDKYGNFLVNTIGYSGDGDVYNVIPMLGVHSFSPATRPVFVSHSSRVHNQIDFTDISSFSVEGKIVYAGTDYPVEGVEFLIDGTTLCTQNGEIVRTDVNGNYKIFVPIGEHFINVRKNGHTFAHQGRYPEDPNGIGKKEVFNKPIPKLNFTDSTLVTIAGRVSGGLVERDKPLGLGQGKANIGKADIELMLAKDQFYLNIDENNEKILNSTNAFVKSFAKIEKGSNIIKITTDPETGEFLVQVPPVPLKVNSISTASVEKVDFHIDQLAPLPDYINPLVTVRDSIITEDNKKITFEYNHALNINYRSSSMFDVSDKRTKSKAFGEEYIENIGADGQKNTIPIYTVNQDGIPDYKFNVPVFRQLRSYTFDFRAYEEYINSDGDEPVVTDVPLEGCIVRVINEFGIQPVYIGGTGDGNLVPENLNEDEMMLDSLGRGSYTFNAGYPNIHDDHTLGLTITYSYNDEMKTWVYDALQTNNGFKAIVLGDLATGNDFVTEGPDLVSYILRDPPGSNSYAYREVNQTTTKTHEWNNMYRGEGSEINVLHCGMFAQTILGTPGVGTITETSAKADVTIGIEWTVEHGSVNSTVNSTTNTEIISTSDSPDYVGADGDVFIGTSSNIVFGLVRNVGIYPDENNGYEIAVKEIMGTGMKIGETAFKYSQYHIENNLIPNFYRMVKSLLKQVGQNEFTENYINTTDSVIYITALNEKDSRYGSLNDDEEIWEDASIKIDSLAHMGPSYKMILPANPKPDSVYLDYISYYTEQAKKWEHELAINEKAKVESIKKGKKTNHSFDAGTIIESSVTSCNAGSEGEVHNWQVRSVAGVQSGAAFSGFGFTSTLETRNGRGVDDSDVTERDTCTTTGYVLKEENQTDYFTIDVLTDTTHTGSVIFSTRAGRSSCPYEREVKPKYYKENGILSNEILSYATMRVEVPVISIDNEPVATNVPSGKEATFILKLNNSSEAGQDVLFDLRALDESNPDGAQLSIDGTPLTSRRPIFVKYGNDEDATLKKTLKLTQTSLDVLEYKDLKIVLSSQCQDDVADTLSISAYFVPSCSDIALVINDRTVNTETSDTLSIQLKDYRLDFKNFKGIRLQYKSINDLSWATFKEYVVAKEEATDGKEWLTTPTVSYQFPMRSLNDGTYDIRAITICDYGTVPVNNETTEIRIIKDMRLPQSLGTPNPSNGILTPDDELSILFNEAIQYNKIEPDGSTNVIVEGVLNGYAIQHNVGLNFDGTGNAYTELPVVNNNSFSIEGWFKRNAGEEGTLFSYGTQESHISLGFTSGNKLIVEDKGKQLESDIEIIDTDWQYLSMVYDREFNDVTILLRSTLHGNISLLPNNSKLSKEAPQSGRLYVGSRVDGTKKFKGQVRQVHLWNLTRTLTDLTDINNGKGGNERGLSGYWNLEEGRGTIAADKAQARNMIISTDWFIYPSGKSVSFDGIGDSLIINSYYYPFTEEDDFTIEFWFKAGEQQDATLLSAGDGIDDKYPDGKLSLYLNSEGKLLMHSNGQKHVVSPQKLTDDLWHHFAMSVRRGGNANFYIDNQQTYQTSSMGSYTVDKTYLGVHKYKTEENTIVKNWFKGNIDEFRIWNTALTNENLKLDTYNRLTGKEVGLVAYYPFDEYSQNSFGEYVVNETPDDKIISADGKPSTLTASGTVKYSDVTPTLKDVRPKETVKFDLTSSENKIVINLLEDISRIENCILEFTVNRVMDANGNTMKPKKWTAYIDMNRLQWDEDRIALEKELYEPLSFNTSISNNSGMNEIFEIKDIPSWLSCNINAGTLKPQQKQELTFTINESVMIGTYETIITLIGSNNVPEPFMVSLKVEGEKPDWTVDPNKYESSMNILGQIRIEGIYQEDPNDIIAAFIDNECRGVVSPKYIQTHNNYYVFMDIYGDNEDLDKPVSFRIWDASTGFIYSSVNVNMDVNFKPLNNVGSFNNPLIFDALNVVEQQIVLRNGWNWISVNVSNDSPSLFDMFKENIGEAGEIIKSSDSYAQAPSWKGSGTFGINNYNMYRVQTNKAHTLRFNGKLVDVSEHPLIIKNGWNWISYLPSFPLTVKEALAGLDASDGDFIKAQNGYATYVQNVGWIGSLQYMTPGSGYMYKSESSSNKSLVYPSKTNMSKSTLIVEEINKKWTADPSRFQTNMTITAIVTIDGEALYDTAYEIGIFKGNECRGSALLTYEEEFDNYLIYLMVYGDSGENLEFKTYNHNTKEIVDFENRMLFESDKVLGRPDDPYILKLGNTAGIPSDKLWNIDIYPNPVEEYANLTCPDNLLSLIDLIEITAMNGVKVMSIENPTSNAINVGKLVPGAYIMHIYIGDKTVKAKLVKK